jgi:ketosteroid isomerase-like protein
MSQENVEWVRESYAAWGRGDMAAVEALSQNRLASNFEMYPLYLDQAYTGVEGIRSMWANAGESWEDYRSETDEVIDLGDHVLVVGRVLARGPGSGVPVDQPVAMLWTFEGTKAVRARSFRSKAEALEAVGLSE